MTRSERINKLAHACREYRGIYNAATGKWRNPPKPSARPRVGKWLGELKLDMQGSMTLIDNFKTGDEFRAWLRKL